MFLPTRLVPPAAVRARYTAVLRRVGNTKFPLRDVFFRVARKSLCPALQNGALIAKLNRLFRF